MALILYGYPPTSMTELPVEVFSDFDAFARAWEHNDNLTTKLVWQLLSELSEDELLIILPEWLAAKKTGYIEGATPTQFVGRIEEETEKAIRLTDSAAARPLVRIAHRIASLRSGIAGTEPGDDRRAWLEDRLEDHQRQFRDRGDLPGLRDEWLPKSQIRTAVRRTG